MPSTKTQAAAQELANLEDNLMWIAGTKTEYTKLLKRLQFARWLVATGRLRETIIPLG